MNNTEKIEHPYSNLVIDYSGEWVIPGADDDKGHNVTEKFCLRKEWLAQMDRMVKAQKFPYINRGQLIRHALFMLFVWIDTLEDKQLPTSDLTRIESMRTLLIEEKMISDFNDVMVELAKRVKSCKARGLHKRAVRNVLGVLRKAEEIKELDWKEYFTDKIRADYKQLLASVDDIDLEKKEI